MDLFSVEKERRKQRQIDQYLSTRYHYSAKGRKDAVRFERRRAIRKRAAALARLSEELARCQAVYLNCLHQAGSAHRLAQLIEKVEQIAVSDAKSTQKSKPQENADKLPCVRSEQSANSKVNKLSSKLIKTAFQNEVCSSLVMAREMQLTKTIESKRSIGEQTRLGEDGKSSRTKSLHDGYSSYEINEFGQETVQMLNDQNKHDKTLSELKKERDEQSASHLTQSSDSFEDTALEFEFIYSINERSVAHSASQSTAQSAAQSTAQSAAKPAAQPESQSETSKEIKKSIGGQNTIDNQIKSDESFARKLVETIERSKIQSLETEDTFSVGPSYGRKLFKEINYSDSRTENVQRNEATEKEKIDLEADKEQLDVKKDNKQSDKQSDRQTSDRLASEQISSLKQLSGGNLKQTNEVKPKESKRLVDNGEFNPIRSQKLSVQMFEESGKLDTGQHRDEPNAESRSDRGPDYEAERSDYKSDQKSNGSKAVSSSDYKANTADYDGSHNLNYSQSYNLDLEPGLELADHSEHRTVHYSEEIRQVGKDTIKGEELNRTIGRTNEQQNQIRANVTVDAPVTRRTDYARRESFREIYEELHEKFYEELYEVSSRRWVDERSEHDERDKLNAKDLSESRKDRQPFRRTAEQTTRRFLPDDLEENLSLRTPSPNSLNESLESRLFYSTDELPDLRLSSPTLSSCSSFPSIDSLSTLISTANDLARTRKKCPNCLSIREAKQGLEVRRHGESRKESGGRKTERSTRDAPKRTTNKNDNETFRKRIERDRQRKAVETKDGKRMEKFSFEAFWDDVLKDESSSEGRLVDLDQLKRQLNRQLAKFKMKSTN